MWFLIDGSPRRGKTLRSAWKRDAAIIRPINGDAYGNVSETLKRDNEKGQRWRRQSLSGALKSVSDQAGIAARFNRGEGGAFLSGNLKKCLS